MTTLDAAPETERAPQFALVREAVGSPLAIVRKGLRLSPEFTRGIGVTLLLALIATVGRIVIPIAVQQAVDHGFDAPGGVNAGEVRAMATLAALAVLATTLAASSLGSVRDKMKSPSSQPVSSPESMRHPLSTLRL